MKKKEKEQLKKELQDTTSPKRIKDIKYLIQRMVSFYGELIM